MNDPKNTKTLRSLVEAANGINSTANHNAKKRDEAYRQKVEEIHRQIRSLTDYIRQHEEKARKSPGDWGYVGDLQMISDKIYEILTR